MFVNTNFKRDLNDVSFGAGSNSARWAFFAIFIVLVIIIIIGTIRVNKRRTSRGVQPIYGTRWMTPPSYLQSQNQYNRQSGTNPEFPNNYVPRYTEEANEQDMGYYDSSGKFHPNPNAHNPLASSIAMPDGVHERSYSASSSSGVPLANMPNIHNEIPAAVSSPVIESNRPNQAPAYTEISTPSAIQASR